MAPTLKDSRDGNYVCKCGCDIAHMKTLDSGRRVFQCNCDNPICKGEILECLVCHLPKTIWADDGTVCGGCALNFMEGEIELTDVQIAGIAKWMVVISLEPA